MKLTPIASATLFTTISFTNSAFAANPEHTRQLLSTGQCAGCDLTNAGLVMANLANANLMGADLSRANLSRANLMGADLRGANLTGASLHGANLTGANLSGANLAAADLRDTFLTQANLVGVNLVNANLLGAVGVPSYSGTAEDFYRWGMAEAARDNFGKAMQLIDRSLEMNPDYASAYLGRSTVRYYQGDRQGAIADSKRAAELYTAQNDLQGAQLAQDIAKKIEEVGKPRRSSGSSNFLNFVQGLAGLALQLFL